MDIIKYPTLSAELKRISIIPKIDHLKSPEGRNFLALQEVDLNAQIRADYSSCYAHVRSKLFEPTAASIAKRHVNCQPSSSNCTSTNNPMCPSSSIDLYAHVGSKLYEPTYSTIAGRHGSIQPSLKPRLKDKRSSLGKKAVASVKKKDAHVVIPTLKAGTTRSYQLYRTSVENRKKENDQITSKPDSHFSHIPSKLYETTFSTRKSRYIACQNSTDVCVIKCDSTLSKTAQHFAHIRSKLYEPTFASKRRNRYVARQSPSQRTSAVMSPNILSSNDKIRKRGNPQLSDDMYAAFLSRLSKPTISSIAKARTSAETKLKMLNGNVKAPAVTRCRKLRCTSLDSQIKRRPEERMRPVEIIDQTLHKITECPSIRERAASRYDVIEPETSLTIPLSNYRDLVMKLPLHETKLLPLVKNMVNMSVAEVLSSVMNLLEIGATKKDSKSESNINPREDIPEESPPHSIIQNDDLVNLKQNNDSGSPNQKNDSVSRNEKDLNDDSVSLNLNDDSVSFSQDDDSISISLNHDDDSVSLNENDVVYFDRNDRVGNSCSDLYVNGHRKKAELTQKTCMPVLEEINEIESSGDTCLKSEDAKIESPCAEMSLDELSKQNPRCCTRRKKSDSCSFLKKTRSLCCPIISNPEKCEKELTDDMGKHNLVNNTSLCCALDSLQEMNNESDSYENPQVESVFSEDLYEETKSVSSGNDLIEVYECNSDDVVNYITSPRNGRPTSTTVNDIYSGEEKIPRDMSVYDRKDENTCPEEMTVRATGGNGGKDDNTSLDTSHTYPQQLEKISTCTTLEYSLTTDSSKGDEVSRMNTLNYSTVSHSEVSNKRGVPTSITTMQKGLDYAHSTEDRKLIENDLVFPSNYVEEDYEIHISTSNEGPKAIGVTYSALPYYGVRNVVDI